MQTLKRWLFLFVVWVLNKIGHDIMVISGGVHEVLEAADGFVQHYEASPNIPGEAKRHQVYARLIKAFPETPKYVLGLAIELAVHRRRLLG